MTVARSDLDLRALAIVYPGRRRYPVAEGVDAVLLRDLARRKPLYIVDDQAAKSLIHDPRFAHYDAQALQLPGLSDFIGNHYRPYALFGRCLVYRRG